MPGLGEHLFRPIHALTAGFVTTFSVNSHIDIRIVKIPIRIDNDGMLNYIGMKFFRDPTNFSNSTGSALSPEVVCGKDMGVGTAFTSTTIEGDASAFSTTVSVEVWH